MISRALLTFFAAVLWAIGWFFGKAALVLLWIGAALRIGWADAHRKRSETT